MDFDGTITEEDNIIALMRRFAPDEWVTLKDAILAQHISIRDGVGQLFRLLPSEHRDVYQSYLSEHITLRQGFLVFPRFRRSERLAI